jgi:hypothetical protein
MLTDLLQTKLKFLSYIGFIGFMPGNLKPLGYETIEIDSGVTAYIPPKANNQSFVSKIMSKPTVIEMERDSSNPLLYRMKQDLSDDRNAL